MKKSMLPVLILAFNWGLSTGTGHVNVVACVGDSNTFGYGLHDRTHDSYPAQLERLLHQQTHSDWDVHNFGFSGATVLRNGDIPYTNQAVYYEALASEPDYVVICFGPNGSRTPNRGYIQGHYVSDYLRLIDSFLALPSQPKVVLCYPLKAFSEIYTFSDVIIADQIIPLIAQIASERDLPLVDFYTAFENLPDLYQSDGIHPIADGAGLMAELAAASLLTALAPPDYNGDGTVDLEDLLILIDAWGQSDPLVDIVPPFGDGVVDVLDLQFLMDHWQQPIADPTLVAHWALDQTEGVVDYEEVNEYDGMVLGGALWQPDDGQVDGAIQMDGVDDVIVADHAPSLTYRPFSILAWVRAGVAGQTLISEQSEANWLSADPWDGSLMTELAAAGSADGLLRSEAIITDGAWHRVGLVWDGTQRRLYVDGIAVVVDQQKGMDVRSSGLYIGCGMNLSAGTYWSGWIDDVRLYSRAVKP